MFEGHIKALGLGEADESSVMRQLRWTDLVARLEATRELRAELGRPSESGFAAFSAQQGEAKSACSDAKLHGGENGKRAVNQDVLSHGKVMPRRQTAVANDAADGDRDEP